MSSPKQKGPSKQEKALSQSQADLLNEQRANLEENKRLQDLLQPVLLEQSGLIPQYGQDHSKEIVGYRTVKGSDLLGTKDSQEPIYGQDESKKIIGFGQSADQKKLTDLQRSIQLQELQRTSDALAGNLPVDPATMKDLSLREDTLNNQLIKDFGSLSAAQNSTAGQARLNDFGSFKENVLSNARRGDLTLAQQLANPQGAANAASIGNTASVVNLPFQGQGFNNLAQGFGQAIDPLASFRNQGNAQRAQSSASTNSLLGTLGGLAAYAWLA